VSTLLAPLAYYWRRPRELADRIGSEWERRTERPSSWAPEDADYAEDPVAAIHHLLGLADSPCVPCAEFDAFWEDLGTRFGGWHHHDSGIGTVRAAWSATRHLRPHAAVETGVARGFTSATVLAAMRANGEGRLWSIDLPEVHLVRSGAAGAAVDASLAERWVCEQGSSRRLLPSLLDRLGEIDLFVHDSLHTRANMLFEMQAAWAHLRPGGLLLADDVDHNTAFSEFARRVAAPHVVGRQGTRAGAFGALHKVAA
jgi:hypothetical protein